MSAVPVATQTGDGRSLFKAALPYGLMTLTVGTLGAIIAATAASKVIVIVGAIFAVMGAYAFFGVIGAAIFSENVSKFKENIWKAMATTAGVAVSNIISEVARMAILSLFFGNRRD